MDSLETCECCWKRRGSWHLMEENAEVMLCRTCAADLRRQGSDVTRMDVG